MNKKIRIFTPVIALFLVALVLVIAGIASIISEAKQPQETEPTPVHAISTVSQAEGQAPAETEISPEPEASRMSEVQILDLNDEDSYRLLKIAMAEAEGESVQGKALVMLVVLNRVKDKRFPDTVEEVLFQKNQFSPVREGGRYWTTEPDEGCYEALELVMNGWDESQGALYFESTGRDGWHSRNLEFLFQMGGHKFYR